MHVLHIWAFAGFPGLSRGAVVAGGDPACGGPALTLTPVLSVEVAESSSRQRRLATSGRLRGRGAMACSFPELRPFPHIFCKTFSALISYLADKTDSTFVKVMVLVLPNNQGLRRPSVRLFWKRLSLGVTGHDRPTCGDGTDAWVTSG